jgi:lipoprotein-anchoring transpeptidase ErfK/SrfK
MNSLKKLLYLLTGMLILLSVFVSCTGKFKEPLLKNFQYEKFKDSVLKRDTGKTNDTSNIFDNKPFIPGEDSLDNLMMQLDSLLHKEAILMVQLDSLKKGISKEPGFTEEEKSAISENIRAVNAYLEARDSTPADKCSGKDCILYVEIDKSAQTLYLYLLGELKDSFLVSTGKGKKYETPQMSLHPRGPVLTKYTSRKFPGGNYKGMGNMPYAVFVKGGYAIHGTTPGNFSKLGKKASHGCIRLHPDNAKVFNALVKTIGLSRTWVTVKESLP